MQQYINFRLYTDYSLGFGVSKLKDIVEHCVNHAIPAIAITDKYNLFAALEFAIECEKKGIQPIIGAVLRFVPHGWQPESRESLPELLFIAKNQQGYNNLVKMVSESYLAPALSQQCSVNIAQIKKYSQGLVLLYGGIGSVPYYHINRNDHKSIATDLQTFMELFPEHLYIEISRNHLENELLLETILLNKALEFNIPIIGTSETCFVESNKHVAQDALLCIANGRFIQEESRPRANTFSYFKSTKQMQELFADLPEALQNTIHLAQRCSYYPQEKEPLLPGYPDLTPGNTADDELRIQAQEGLQVHCVKKNILLEERAQYLQRLEYEIETISNMNYAGYFLIVADFVRWSKKNGIPVGPGRGSGVGSIVAWSLGITDIDPLRYGLLFERFLNPERVSMPDFDIDFCQDRRDEVIDYVRMKYGNESVAQIITFGKLQARAVLRDVGRVSQIPYGLVDKICKMVPNNPTNPVTLPEAIKLDRDLQKMQKQDHNIAELLDTSIMLEGVNRHCSTHAAGIVIADRPLVDLIPLYKDQNTAMPAVQYSMKFAEKAGLIKFDFLGLKTVTVISWCEKLIREMYTDDKDFDISSVQLDDGKTYDLLSKGQTIGIFQFEGAGMREAIKNLKPTSIEDLMALGSLYRPGPMDNIPAYINCKHGIEKPVYLHPKLEEVLRETYGIIIYQEQVMRIAQDLAGFTLGSADLLRRAMGKKIKSEMESLREDFVNGSVENGVENKLAEEIFELVNKFASYGFNKSHAAAYAMISYQTAYLKANYPLQFIVSSLNLEIDDTDKINLFIQDAKNMELEIVPPDINKSGSMFSIVDNKIVYGLAALKNVGEKVTDEIVRIREEEGDFKDIFDFTVRCNGILNKRVFESLIKSGALDCLYNNRHMLYTNIELLVKNSAYITSLNNTKQISLFGEEEIGVNVVEMQEVQDWNFDIRLQNEFEAVGFYLSQHPLKAHMFKLEKIGAMYSHEIESIGSPNGMKALIAGVITSKKIRSSKRGKYAFLQISDPYGLIEVSIFDEKLLYQGEALLNVGNALGFEVEVRRDEGGARITVSKLLTIEEMMSQVDYVYNIIITKDDAFDKLQQYICDNGVPFNIVVKRNTGSVVIDVPKKYAIPTEHFYNITAIDGIEIQEG